MFGVEAAVVGVSLIACFAETLMDSRWATTELAWTTYPESGVSYSGLLFVIVQKGGYQSTHALTRQMKGGH